MKPILELVNLFFIIVFCLTIVTCMLCCAPFAVIAYLTSRVMCWLDPRIAAIAEAKRAELTQKR